MSATFNIPRSSRGSALRTIHRGKVAGTSRTRSSVVLLFFIVISGVSAGAQTCAEPSSGILAWWPLDETSGTIAHDIAGTHPAVRFGTPSSAAGKVGGSLRFHGSDFIGAADSDLWAFAGRSFTIELWANFDELVDGSVGHPGAIFIGNDEGPGGRAKWFFALGGGFLNFHINSPALGPKFFPLAPFSPKVGQWYHLAVTRNANLYTLFVDGAPIGSAVNDDLIPDPNVSLTIGQAESLGFVHGRLDELTVYGRALTQSELQSIVAAGSAGKCKDNSDIQGTVVPSKGGDTGSVTVRITGQGFAEGTTVRLLREGNIEIVGNPVQIIDGLSLTGTFDLAGRARGAWDLVIENPDGSDLNLAQAFTIEEGRAPDLWVDVVGRGAIMLGRSQKLYIIYGNRGNVDIEGAVVLVRGFPAAAIIEIDSAGNLMAGPIFDGSQIDPTVVIGEERVMGFSISNVPPGGTDALGIDLTVLTGGGFQIEVRTWEPL